MMRVKHGVNLGGLKMPMEKAWNWYRKLFQLTGFSPVLTDAVAERSSDSLHPIGYAIDVRTRDLDVETASFFSRVLQEILGDEFDVVLYSTHIHIEYQKHLDDSKDWSPIDVTRVE